MGDQATVARVLLKGGTPAGSHVPIMAEECLAHLGLASGETEISTLAPSFGGVGGALVAVDCTLGFGGHSGLILDALTVVGLRGSGECAKRSAGSLRSR
jgi:16S rRNA C1402 N4-methylase RsmH